MTSTDFWGAIEAQLTLIRSLPMITTEQVIDVLDEPGSIGCGDAFFAGSGGDYQLSEALFDAGWDIHSIEGDYHWTATHPRTGDSLTYCEGDVYRGIRA